MDIRNIKNFSLDHITESIDAAVQGSVSHLQERARDIKKDLVAGFEAFAALKGDGLSGLFERAAAVFVVDAACPPEGPDSDDGSVSLYNASLDLNNYRIQLDNGRPFQPSRVPRDKRLRVVLLLVPLDD